MIVTISLHIRNDIVFGGHLEGDATALANDFGLIAMLYKFPVKKTNYDRLKRH